MRRVFLQSHPFGISVFIIIVLILTIYFGCSEESPVVPPPPEPPKAVSLRLVDVSCTEAFIKVSAADSVLPLNISLRKDDSTIANFTLTKPDTVIIDTTLQPNNTYIYQTTEVINGKEEKSDTLQVKALNITSDNFTWQTYTFGDPNFGSSLLRDVAVIDENNIFAVGEIYNDTTGQAYNAVHWNGNNWELIRIMTNACGGVLYPPIQAIFAFSLSDILFAHIDGSISHYDGIEFINDCSLITQLNGSANKIWGKSRNDFYVVSGNGFIARYENEVWNKIESGTTTDINDIWGYYNDTSNEESVLCVVSNILHQGELRLLAISENTAHDTLNWPYSNHWLKSVWFKSKYSPVYVVGGGIKEYKSGAWTELNVTNDFVECIRGSDVNNIFACGDYGFLGHFNGVQWNVFNNLYNDAVFLQAAVKDNTVVVVGYTYSGQLIGKAIVIIGKRIG
jgi:hypothetical protein